MIITMKQMSGSMNDMLTAGMPQMVPWSIMSPWRGGIRAPPTIAMTRKAAPRWVSLVSTFSKAMP